MKPEEFNLSYIIEGAWKQVEALYNRGLIPNENPCNFILSRAIWDELPEGVNLTYDNVASERPRIVPDLVIWSESVEPTVLFIGEMKFWPHYKGKQRDVEEDLENLSYLLNAESIKTLTLDPHTGQYDDRVVKISPETQAGYFITARHNSPHVKPENIRKVFSPSSDSNIVNRLHICTGRVYGDKSKEPEFRYLKPTA